MSQYDDHFYDADGGGGSQLGSEYRFPVFQDDGASQQGHGGDQGIAQRD
jgi:hypothetical protein